MRFSSFFRYSLLSFSLLNTFSVSSDETEKQYKPERWRQFGYPVCEAALTLTVEGSGAIEAERRKVTLEALTELRNFRQTTLGFDNSIIPNIHVVHSHSAHQKNIKHMAALAARIRGLELNLGESAGGTDEEGKHASFGIRVVGNENVLEAIKALNNDPVSPWTYFKKIKAPLTMISAARSGVKTGLFLGGFAGLASQSFSGFGAGMSLAFAANVWAAFSHLLMHSLIPSFSMFRDLILRELKNHDIEKTNSHWFYYSDNLYVPLLDEHGRHVSFVWMGVDIMLHFREATESDPEVFQGKFIPELLIFTRGSSDDPTKNYPRKRKPKEEKEELKELQPAWLPIPTTR
ncbi:MAG: hypothetical protein KA116_06895 [Proteobacteria bacterium]|nr:hypothetical protein [Pseudomonadota bacterium]